MTIAEFDEAVLLAKTGDNIVYAKTGNRPRAVMECARGLQEAGLVSLLHVRTGSNVFGPDLGTFDYIAQRTSAAY